MYAQYFLLFLLSFYSIPKKHSWCIAPSKHARNSSSVSYKGKSILLKQVWARGNLLVDNAT